jgi:hypothetical protein
MSSESDETIPALPTKVPKIKQHLTGSFSTFAAVKSLNRSVDIESDLQTLGLYYADVDRFKQKIEYNVIGRDLFRVCAR